MNRRVLPVIFSFVCALSLVLIPMSYSWAQSSDKVNQQDQTQTDRNENQDVNQDQRQKPASEPNTMQDQQQTQPQTTDQKAGQSREGLPATAGELPLLGLIGILTLAPAGSTRLFARAKSTR